MHPYASKIPGRAKAQAITKADGGALVGGTDDAGHNGLWTNAEQTKRNRQYLDQNRGRDPSGKQVRRAPSMTEGAQGKGADWPPRTPEKESPR